MTKVEKAQHLLAFLDLPTGGYDGIVGRQTSASLKKVQRAYGLSETGQVDDQTIKALRDAVAYGLPEVEEKEEEKTGTYWDDIKYFVRDEFRCPCGECGGFPVEPQEGIVRESDALREYLGVPVTIVPADGHSGGSGVRCQKYNDSLPGSVPNSWHVQGKAVDFCAPGVSNAMKEKFLAQEVAAGRLRYYYRIGSSNNYHMDIP